ncbi:MAG TPA: PP2C family protein-serine/threonine phosphatase, partial [Pyrinomonadaceae bacterium]|nr:PP2C family protein-serine/threonine phosphatase [Pyrinomonadaceae bacterium]
GKLIYINAGHNPPLLCRADGTITQLDSGGLPLGLMEMAQYESGELMLGQGDTLVVYSDGVSEATNEAEDEYGLERLEEVVRTHRGASAAGLRDKIESSLSSFTLNAPAADDVTLLIVKRN